ncbi:Hypothetical_protein [Hexamita inflata]|uniref:Hypothetical_protein n=1 Tax=Hexamita inflata TaxID=28002 RepID=A0ABP1HME3_9EUKA
MRCHSTNRQLKWFKITKNRLKLELGLPFSTFRQSNQIVFGIYEVKLKTVKWNGSEETGELNATQKNVKRLKTKLGKQTQNQNMKRKSSVTQTYKMIMNWRILHLQTRSTFINYVQKAVKMLSSKQWQMLRSFKLIIANLRIQKVFRTGTSCWN